MPSKAPSPAASIPAATMIWPGKGNDKGKAAAVRMDDGEALPPPSYAEVSPSSSSSSSSTRLPIVIPQSMYKPPHAYIAPFLRAAPSTSDMAQHYGLSTDGFLRFVDGVNRACTAPAAVQAVRLTDSLTRIGPLGALKSVSMAINTLAGAGSRATGYTRTLACVRKANDDLFAPRGLHVCIVSTTKMRELLDGCKDTQQQQQQHELGPPPVDERLGEMHAVLQGQRVAALVLEESQSSSTSSVFDKANAWQSRRDEKRKERRCRDRAAKRQCQEARWIVVIPMAKTSAAETHDDDVDLASDGAGGHGDESNEEASEPVSTAKEH